MRTRSRCRVHGVLAVLYASSVLLPAQEPVPPQARPPQARPQQGQPPRPAAEQPAQQDPAPPAGGAAPAQPPTPAVPQTPQQPGVPGGLDPQQLAQAMAQTLRFAAPGPQHERLGKLVGDWDIELQLQLPGTEPETTKGRGRAGDVLGGRYLVLEFRVPVRGVPLDGLYLFGYDRLRDLWSASWRDSLSTWSIEAFGTQDPSDEQLLHFRGLVFDVASPEGRDFRIDFAFGDADHFTITVFDTVRGERVQVMQQRFSRRAAEPGAPGAQDGGKNGGKGGDGKDGAGAGGGKGGNDGGKDGEDGAPRDGAPRTGGANGTSRGTGDRR